MDFVIARKHIVWRDAEDAVAVFFKLFKAKVVRYYEEDNQRGADAYRKANDIDKREDFVSPEIAQGNGEVIFKHTRLYLVVSKLQRVCQ